MTTEYIKVMSQGNLQENNSKFIVNTGSSTAFVEDLKFSHSYDRFISQFLSSYFNSPVEVVEDLERQKQGIDFIVKQNPEIKVDLKLYRKDSGKLYLEKYTDRRSSKLGWLEAPASKTDLYIFFMPTTQRLILASKPVLINMVKTIEEMKPDDLFSFYRFNGNSWGSYYAVPIDTFKMVRGKYLFQEIDLRQLYGGAD